MTYHDGLVGLSNKDWIELIRETRLLAGDDAARRMWRLSPLPPIEEEPDCVLPDETMASIILRFVTDCTWVTGKKRDTVTAADLHAAFADWQARHYPASPPMVGRMTFFRGLKGLSKEYTCPTTGGGFRRAKVSVSIYQGLLLRPAPAPVR